VVLGEPSPGPREQYVDTTKARTRLGWIPRHGLDEGLRRTIEWYRACLADEAVQARPKARAAEAPAGTLP
jgi:dTDP-D-glucose 4,6-dehydratase